jgi:hypothetical protein
MPTARGESRIATRRPDAHGSEPVGWPVARDVLQTDCLLGGGAGVRLAAIDGADDDPFCAERSNLPGVAP